MVIEYIYARSKNEYVETDGVESLFLYAGLTKNTYLDPKKRKVNVKTVVSKLIETPKTEALSSYLSLQDGDIRLVISKDEFEELLLLSESDEVAFYIYMPDKN